MQFINERKDMKAIYRIVNIVSGRVFYIGATEDIEATHKAFDEGVLPEKRHEKYKHKESLKLEVAEYTDNLAERYAFYCWPSIQRIVYEKALMQASLDSKVTQAIDNVTEFLIDCFTDQRFSFRLFLIDNNYIGAWVYEDGAAFEYYEFSRSGKPKVRGMFV